RLALGRTLSSLQPPASSLQPPASSLLQPLSLIPASPARASVLLSSPAIHCSGIAHVPRNSHCHPQECPGPVAGRVRQGATGSLAPRAGGQPGADGQPW